VDAANPHLLDAVGELDKDGRRELLSFVNAINIDSVILPFRPHLAGTLRALAGLLDKKDDGAGIREVLGMATSTAAVPVVEEDNSKKPIVELLRDMRFMQLGVPACASLFKTMPMLSAALARCLSSVANAVDKFVLEWCKGPDATQEYQKKWECGKRLQEEMCNDVEATYLQAATSHERTGTCAPALLQCRPEPFLWEEVLSTGMRSKHYAKAHKFSSGAMTFCCGCKHPLILAFTVLDRKEAPQVLLNMLLTRFVRLPHFLIYKLTCGAFRVAHGKLGLLLMDCTVVSDRFHFFNHLCSVAFDPRSYMKMDGADTDAPEQRNSPIRRIQTTQQSMGVEPYTNLIAYQRAISNHDAQNEWVLGVDRLPEDADRAGEYFSRFPCLCCDDIGGGPSDGVPPEREASEGELLEEQVSEGRDSLSDSSGGTSPVSRDVEPLDGHRRGSETASTHSDGASYPFAEASSSDGGSESGESDGGGDASIGLSYNAWSSLSGFLYLPSVLARPEWWRHQWPSPYRQFLTIQTATTSPPRAPICRDPSHPPNAPAVRCHRPSRARLPQSHLFRPWCSIM